MATWTGYRHQGVVSDNEANIATPEVGLALMQVWSPSTDQAYHILSGLTMVGYLHALEVRLGIITGPVFFVFTGGIREGTSAIPFRSGPLTFPAITSWYSGFIWIGASPFRVLFAFRSADQLTLVGRVKEQLQDLTEVDLPNVRIHFESTNVIQLFDATKADASGGYVVFLDTGSDYLIAGSNEKTCKVYEIVRLDVGLNTTDIILKVPDGCVIPESDPGMAESDDDVRNKEIGFHAYEPVHTGQVIRQQDIYRQEDSGAGAGVAVAIGESATILDVVLTNAIAINSILVGSDGDCEFRFLIDAVEIVPRRVVNGDAPGQDLMNGGSFYANATQRLRVIATNLTTGSTAQSIQARATIVGRNA